MLFFVKNPQMKIFKILDHVILFRQRFYGYPCESNMVLFFIIKKEFVSVFLSLSYYLKFLHQNSPQYCEKTFTNFTNAKESLKVILILNFLFL